MMRDLFTLMSDSSNVYNITGSKIIAFDLSVGFVKNLPQNLCGIKEFSRSETR